VWFFTTGALINLKIAPLPHCAPMDLTLSVNIVLAFFASLFTLLLLFCDSYYILSDFVFMTYGKFASLMICHILYFTLITVLSVRSSRMDFRVQFRDLLIDYIHYLDD